MSAATMNKQRAGIGKGKTMQPTSKVDAGDLSIGTEPLLEIKDSSFFI